MSLNPAFQTDGIPVLMMGESIILCRRNMKLISDIGGFKVNSDGCLYLTTLRLVFNADRPTPTFAGLDVPLMSIRNEAFNQPLFGRNNLSFNVVPHTNWGSGVAFSVKLEFCNGGAQTFLRAFWRLMSGVNDCRNAPMATAVPDVIRSISSGHFASSAFVDPSDPTYIYTSQPYTPTTPVPQYYPVPSYYSQPYTPPPPAPAPYDPNRPYAAAPAPAPAPAPYDPNRPYAAAPAPAPAPYDPNRPYAAAPAPVPAPYDPNRPYAAAPAPYDPNRPYAAAPAPAPAPYDPNRPYAAAPAPYDPNRPYPPPSPNNPPPAYAQGQPYSLPPSGPYAMQPSPNTPPPQPYYPNQPYNNARRYRV